MNYSNIVWPERRGFWRCRKLRHFVVNGVWISYDDIVWC